MAKSKARQVYVYFLVYAGASLVLLAFFTDQPVRIVSALTGAGLSALAVREISRGRQR
jgi:hypothetical protein